jgi:hypothetical protein
MKKPAAFVAAATIFASAIVVACTDQPQEVYMVPYIIPPIGNYGQPGYVYPRTIYPGEPGYRPTYGGMPPGWKPPTNASVVTDTSGSKWASASSSSSAASSASKSRSSVSSASSKANPPKPASNKSMTPVKPASPPKSK